MKVTKIFVIFFLKLPNLKLYKYRLLRFGFELVEHFANLNNVKIEVLDKIDKNQDEELVEDLVQIITVFS